MAHCLVPELPAVQLVLEHLKDLDRQLTEEGVPFASEASVHLTALTAAVSELETNRRAAHEQLEVETIENSKLRHQIKNMSDRMNAEILADIAAARTSNAEEMEQLRKNLNLVSHLQEDAREKLQALLNQNEALHTEREQVKAEHKAVIADLNDQIDLKCNLQMQLDQKLRLIEEIKSSVAAVQQENMSLQENMVLEREACSEKKLSLSREANEIRERIKLQEEAIKKRREELDGVNDKKEESLQRLGKLSAHMDEQESCLQRVAASRSQFEQQLKEEVNRSKDLCQQMETLEKESYEFKVTARNLQEEIATMERKIEEEQTSGLLLRKTLLQVREVFKHQHNEESKVRAEHVYVSQQLKRSELQLEERITSIGVLNNGIKEMKKEIKELQEAEVFTRREFERNQEELCRDLETVKDKISQCEEDKRRSSQLLEELKSRQEQHVEKMTSDISHAKSRYEELLQEEAALLQLQPKSADTDLLMSYITQYEMEYKQTENILLQELQQISAEIQNTRRSTEEKQRDLEEIEETLKEVEVKWTKMQNKHDRLTRELSLKRTKLELSIQHTKDQTQLLLEPKENLKAELEKLQVTRMDLMKKQTSELLTAEVSIYNDNMMLRQIRMENSKMDLRIRQMMEDLTTYIQETEQFQQEEQKLQHKTKDTLESLQEAWRQDIELIQKCQSRDEDHLELMNSLMNHLKSREKQLMAVLTILHQNMLDFSKRLGDKATSKQQI